MNPISVNFVDGIVARTANVPASTNPAEVITPPGGGQPDDRAVPGVPPDRLLADPGHQEDVVVDGQRDQEHEQRERGIHAAEPEHVVEEESADAEGGGEGEHHRGGQDQERHQRPQQQPEDDEHHDQDERVTRFRSCADARLISRLIAVVPPTSALAPGTACTADRTRSIVV